MTFTSGKFLRPKESIGRAVQTNFSWKIAWQQWWDMRSQKVQDTHVPAVATNDTKESGLGELKIICDSQEVIFVPGVKGDPLVANDINTSYIPVSRTVDADQFQKFCEKGQLQSAFEVINLMDKQGILVSAQLFSQILKECTRTKNLDVGKQVHSLIQRGRMESDTFVASYLVRMFSMCGSLSEASSAFDKIQTPNVFSWSAIILAYVKHGQPEQALKYFADMHQTAVKPDEHVFVAALKACTSLGFLKEGKQIHSDIMESGFELDEGVGSALIDLYAKCGILIDAEAVFDKLQKRFLLPWNVLLTGYVQHEKNQEAFLFFHQMLEKKLELNHVTYLNMLKACGNLCNVECARVVHSDIVENGFGSLSSICNTLIDMYSKCGNVEDAYYMFENLESRDVVSWNAMISGLASRDDQQALNIFAKMHQEGKSPNDVTYVNILKACHTTGTEDLGMSIHAQITENGYDTDVIIGSCVVDMYARFGQLKDARAIFDKLTKHDVISYNTMITGYAQHGEGQAALGLLHRMLSEGKKPDDATLVSVLKSCSSVSCSGESKSIHNLILGGGYELELPVASTLLDMYIKSANMKEARSLFDKMPKKDVVTWNALLTGYAQNGPPEEALDLFQKMQNEGTEPNNITYVTLLKACSSIVALEKGKRIHGHIIENHLELDDFVGNALVDMYAKCGHIDGAQRVFNEIPKRSAVSWSAMIAGYALRSNYAEALKYFEEMQKDGLKPDDVAFVNILSACSHKGLVQEGCNHFRSMIEEHGITPVLEHYTCMADLLSRAGRFLDAEAILKSMPCQSNVVGWMSLLTNCRTHGKVEIGRRCFDRIVSIDGKCAAAYVVMENIYSNAGMQEEADKIEKMRINAEAWKLPGKALVEVESQIHAFIVGDQSHPRSEEIYKKLKTLAMDVHGDGHVPDLHAVQQSMSDLEKDDALCGHCEKLAIAFGLIATPPGTVIRVSKNLRVCNDCHNATKIISKIEDREIIVRDSYRIHHFKDGVCSCGDYV